MARKKYLVMTAGGMGSRMGASVPKQFLELEGKPILRLTIERFLEAVPDIKIITVLPAGHIDAWRQYCLRENWHCPQRLVQGGFTRFHSVKNALVCVPDNALVAIHDGVRPFMSVARIQSLFQEAEEVPALIPVLPVTDSLKMLRKEEGRLCSTGEQVDRSLFYGAQTPQIFWSERLKAAYSLGFNTCFTDDASVAEAYGIPLTFTEGERFNLKITTPEDLVLARAILDSSLCSE